MSENTQKIEPMDYFIYLTNGKRIPIEGAIPVPLELIEEGYTGFIDKDKRMHSFKQNQLSFIIRDGGENFEKIGTIKNYRIYTESGNDLGFDGFSTSINGLFVSRENDVITMVEPIAYISIGDVEEEPNARAQNNNGQESK